jgi:hypothetical protein
VVKNTGKPAETAFEDHWDSIGHCYRFRDQKDLQALNGKGVKDFRKPADYLVSSPRHSLHYAEVKSCHGKTSFPFSSIQPGQHAAAIAEARRGCESYLFYIFSYHHGSWYVMPCSDYAAKVAAGDKSVKFEELAPWDK